MHPWKEHPGRGHSPCKGWEVGQARRIWRAAGRRARCEGGGEVGRQDFMDHVRTLGSILGSGEVRGG